MKHVKYRTNRLHMDFVINGSWCSLVTENGPFIDNPLPIWSGQDQRVYRTFHYDSRHEDYHSTCNLQPCTGTYKAVGINPFMRVSKYDTGQTGGMTQCTVLAKIIWVFRHCWCTSTTTLTAVKQVSDHTNLAKKIRLYRALCQRQVCALIRSHARTPRNIVRNGRKWFWTEVMFTKILLEEKDPFCVCLKLISLVIN
jgi:hypothetical protein